MFELKKNERVDWFRITVDLLNSGVNMTKLSQLSGIPRTTLAGYKQRQTRPQFEEAFILINIWADKTKSSIDDLPVYNPCTSR